MLAVKVIFMNDLEHIAATRELVLTVDDKTSVKSLLALLEAKMGPAILGSSLKYQWRHGAGFVMLSLNGCHIDTNQYDSLYLEHGDEIVLFPPLAGG